MQLQNRFILLFKNVLEISNFENVNFELGFSCFWHIPLSKASSTVVKLLPDCIRGHFLVRTGGKSTRFCSPLWYLQILSQNMLQHLALIWLAPEWIGASLILHTISSEEITLTIILVLLSIAKESNCGKVGWERHYCHLQSHFVEMSVFFWLVDTHNINRQLEKKGTTKRKNWSCMISLNHKFTYQPMLYYFRIPYFLI